MSQWIFGNGFSDWTRSKNVDWESVRRVLGALGDLLARMHVHASCWTAPAGFSRPHLDADALLGKEPRWGCFWEHPALDQDERHILFAARGLLHRQLCSLEKDPGRYGMIHSDMHPDNLLIGGSSISVIDFDDAAHGWFYYDIAAALQPHVERSDYVEWRTVLLESYCKTRALDEFDESLLDTFLLVRDLAEIGWYLQRPEVEALNRRHLKSISSR